MKIQMKFIFLLAIFVAIPKIISAEDDDDDDDLMDEEELEGDEETEMEERYEDDSEFRDIIDDIRGSGTCRIRSKCSKWTGSSCIKQLEGATSCSTITRWCKGRKCNCCLKDLDSLCRMKPKCRFRGGYCIHPLKDKDVKKLCPGGKIKKRLCRGRKCGCCIIKKGKCKCGKRNKNGVYNRHEETRLTPSYVPAHRYPYLVAIDHYPSMGIVEQYSGVIINSIYVMSAVMPSHSQSSTIDVWIAIHSTAVSNGITEKIGVVSYKSSNFPGNNNIALLKLDQTLTFTEYVRPVCLPTMAGRNYLQRKSLVISLEPESLSTYYLKEFFVNIYEDGKNANGIKIVSGGTESIAPPNSSLLCASNYKASAVSSDNLGAPLVVQKRQRNRFALVGILNDFGTTCTVDGVPGTLNVFTKVKDFIDWIFTEIGMTGDFCT